MGLKKITEADLQGFGVVGMEDTPNLSAVEMQKKVEEVVREVVIPAINSNIDATASKEDLSLAVFNSGAGDMHTGSYDENLDGIVNRADNGIFVYTHSDDGLAGQGVNGSFKATIAGTYGAINVNGIAYTVKCGEDSEIELVEDAWYNFILDEDSNTINFKHGGAGVNLRIVGGTAEPASPKENTIWVNTDLEITGWTFDMQAPGYLTKGGVWIKTGTVGAVGINVLKKNWLYVFPQSCMQWNGTEFVKKDMKVYLNGQWSTTAVYLFKDGVFSDIGGWSAGSVTSGNIVVTDVTSAANHYSTKPVDLTDFSRLSVTMAYTADTSQTSYVGISADQSVSFAASINLDKTGETITYDIDLTSVTGSYYIVLDINQGSGSTSYVIYEITII